MGLLDLIYPKYCLECRQPGQYLCQNCLNQLTRSNLVNHQGNLALWPYEGVIRKAILKLKYNFAYDIAHEMADLAINRLKIMDYRLLRDTVLVPVPLHFSREKYRGFNQSVEVGKLIAKGMGWKFIPDLLVRTVPTVTQTGLKREAREQNVRNVFAFNPYCILPATCYLAIVFDDVLTTGSTLNEAKKVLISGGFKQVQGLTIAG